MPKSQSFVFPVVWVPDTLNVIKLKKKKTETGLPKTRRLAEDETEPISFAAIHV